METKLRWLFFFQFVVISILFFVTGSYRNWPYKIESDGKYYYQYLISVWYDGDIDFSNNYNHPRYPFMHTEIDHYHFRDILTPETGRPINVFTTGSAILWFPFFLVASGLAYFLNNLGLTNIVLDGWGLYFQYAVMYAAVIYSTLTILLMFQLLKSHFDRQIAFITPFILFWATNWVYYSIFEVSMSHVYDLFTLVLFVWIYLQAHTRQKTAAYVLAGAVAGLHILVRTQNILTITVLIGYYIIGFIVQDKNRSASLRLLFKNNLLLVITMLLSLVPLFYANIYLYGNIFALPQGSGFLDFFHPEIYGVLFSYRNGLFSHHPILLLALAGLTAALFNYKSEKSYLHRLVLPLLLVFLVQLYINAAAADWWGGHAFGQRRLISSFLLFAFGIAYLQKYLLPLSPLIRAGLWGVFTFFIVMNGYLMIIHLFMWSYDEPHNIADWMFHRAPRMLYIYFR